jgi:MurNAc alpha-1-phosphate uridylyltransferase
LTDHVPKPLVPLGGRALIDHVLDRLADAGIVRAVVNVHYLADRIERHVAARTRPTIVVSDERDALLDTGGGIKRALALIGNAPFLVHNSDTVWIEQGASNIDRLITAWDSARMDCLMLLAPAAGSLGYDGKGDFDRDPATGRLTRRPPDRRAEFVFAGVSMLDPALLADTPEGAFSMNVVWDRALSAGRVFGIVLDGAWMHVGTPEALRAAEQRLNDHDARGR